MTTNSTTTAAGGNPLTVLLTNKVFILVLRIVLGVVFVLASADKVLEPDKFAVAVRGYQLIPIELSNLFAIVIAWGELIAAIMLIFGVFTRQAAAAIFLMLVMFTVAIAIMMVRGVVVDCGCFSNEGGSQTGLRLIIRNLFLMATALMIMRFESGYFGLSKFFSRKRTAK
jgi:uncharacterized membrane protein YphA (DoxX/SURF4 family)